MNCSANFTSANTDAVDPRLDWTVGRDGVPYKDWGVHSSTLGWVRDISYGGFYNAKKNVHEKSSGSQSNVGWNSQHLNSVNIHILRFADLLLMQAEAEVATRRQAVEAVAKKPSASAFSSAPASAGCR